MSPRWLVDIGDAVKAGQLLAELETPELDQQLAGARSSPMQQSAANFEFARVTAQRWQNLAQKQGGRETGKRRTPGELSGLGGGTGHQQSGCLAVRATARVQENHRAICRKNYFAEDRYGFPGFGGQWFHGHCCSIRWRKPIRCAFSSMSHSPMPHSSPSVRKPRC